VIDDKVSITGTQHSPNDEIYMIEIYKKFRHAANMKTGKVVQASGMIDDGMFITDDLLSQSVSCSF